MSKTATISIVFGFLTLAATCHGELPQIVGPHLTTGEKAQNALAAMINAKAKVAEFNAMIAKARERF